MNMLKGYDFSDICFHLTNNTRHGILSSIHLMYVEDGLAKYDGSTYHLKNIGELDFYQEISGFFHSRKKCYVHENMEQFLENVPADVDITYISGGYSFIAAGDYVVDQNFNVYRIVGWDSASGKSEFYWDFLDGDGSKELQKKPYNCNTYCMTNH